jgi:UDP-N-acetylglucosamine--N-acetylmuramyl-(pentapeptide) pyrophosphoryl-undecaprenol N-acetylglucosamine transferase
VAALLRTRGIACAWIGSRNGLEARRAVESGIPYHAIATGRVRRGLAWRNVVDLTIRVPAGIGGASRALGLLRPRVVLATGGYVAVPTMIAAALRGIPIVLHEQVTVPGLASRLGGRLARRVAVTFADSARWFPARKVVVTGNPLRPELRGGSRGDAIARFGLDPALPLVYVTGGAQGARRINRVVGEALGALCARAQVVHQCGDPAAGGDRAWLEAQRAALPVALAGRYVIVPWVGDELAALYAAAALVIARAGAGTVNECCQLGVPALYVPLPGTRGDEQTANARLVERAGGAVVLPQTALTAGRLTAEVETLLASPARLKDMGERARALAIPDAAERLVTLIATYL